MLECIKFEDCKIKTIQIEDERFVSVHDIGIGLGVSFDSLKGIMRHHLPQEYKFSRKEINIDHNYNGSKLFTTILGACRVILGSTHPDQHDIIDFLVEKHNFLQNQAWKAQKTSHVALDNSVQAERGAASQIRIFLWLLVGTFFVLPKFE